MMMQLPAGKVEGAIRLAELNGYEHVDAEQYRTFTKQHPESRGMKSHAGLE